MSVAIPSLEERLERGELVTFAPCPFPLPTADALTFLFQQKLAGSAHKNISFKPADSTVSGFEMQSPEQADGLRALMCDFSRRASRWLGELLPHYAAAWQLDRASFRPEEEATRRLRLTARNDLLHFDAFPSRPTRGWRILRLYVNINPTDDRVWATAEPFAKVLEKYGEEAGLPGPQRNTWVRRIGQGILSLFQPHAPQRSEYDDFMLRFHHFLKMNDDFQERASRKLWRFKPQTAWLFFSDTVSHAELRGQYALEHSFFVSPRSLALPDESPAALLERKSGVQVLPIAA